MILQLLIMGVKLWPYLGFIELDLKLTSTHISNSTKTLRVPFLVTGTDQENSVIIGFNLSEDIITEITKNDLILNSTPENRL